MFSHWKHGNANHGKPLLPAAHPMHRPPPPPWSHGMAKARRDVANLAQWSQRYPLNMLISTDEKITWIWEYVQQWKNVELSCYMNNISTGQNCLWYDWPGCCFTQLVVNLMDLQLENHNTVDGAAAVMLQKDLGSPLSVWQTLLISTYARCIAYLPAKLGHHWGKFR